MDAVKSLIGDFQEKLCGYVQYANLFGVAIGYKIASSISMMAVKRANCFHRSGGKDPCYMNANPYMIAFGVLEILFSQIPDFDQLSWLSIVASVMSFTYSSIGLGLGVAKVIENKTVKGSLTGVSIEAEVSPTDKVWRSFQALGGIALPTPSPTSSSKFRYCLYYYTYN
ncbi:Amino acid permease 3 [Linum grandiflorum]